MQTDCMRACFDAGADDVCMRHHGAKNLKDIQICGLYLLHSVRANSDNSEDNLILVSTTILIALISFDVCTFNNKALCYSYSKVFFASLVPHICNGHSAVGVRNCPLAVA
jgi:hypothetical protein